MRLYVETNFVIELATSQGGAEACWSMVGAAESRDVDLVIPSFALVEPYWTFEARRRNRATLYGQAQKELTQLARSADLRERADELARSLDLFATVSVEHDRALERVREQLRRVARVVALDENVLDGAERYRAQFGLSPFDAVVAASVLADIGPSAESDSIFATRDQSDFNEPQLVAEFRERGCEVLYSFESAWARIQAAGD